MKEGVKKSISLILVLTLLVQLLPMVAFGVGDEADDLDISTDSETVSMKDDDAQIVGEEDALREESVKHFRLQDGGYMLVEYETAVHYQTADGSWEEIDNTLQKTGQQYVAQAGDMTRKFAASLDSGFLFETAYQGQSVSMSLARRSSRDVVAGRRGGSAGGGTGLAGDIDEEDLAGDGYYQLIVWDPAEQEIVGGYRFIVCTSENPRHLSTEHYFTFSDKFRKEYLPYTIELGRSFVQPSYQSRGNSKSIYALDNLWDGLGALVVLNPKVKYLFGKVTMYASYKAMARNALIWFLRRYFPDPDHLVAGKNPVQLDLDDPYYEHFFTGKTYEENYRILIQRIREFNENIPPLINAYMNLSPTMRVFDTVINTDFGGVEETGILLTIPDIYPEKKQRYMRWQGWRENLKQRREHFRLRLQEHLSRIGKRWEV